VNDRQAIALHEAVDKIMRRFKLEPGMLAGSAYADLHVNDVGLLAVLAEPGDWNVRKITQTLSAPFSTISSALDRLEARSLVGRRRRKGIAVSCTSNSRRPGCGWPRNYALHRSKPAAQGLRGSRFATATNSFVSLLKSLRNDAQSLNDGAAR
jgi:hypothetical protein